MPVQPVIVMHDLPRWLKHIETTDSGHSIDSFAFRQVRLRFLVRCQSHYLKSRTHVNAPDIRKLWRFVQDR